MNFFDMEASDFERDVHVLILGTLQAGPTYLSSRSQETDKEFDAYLKTATGEASDHAVDMQVAAWSTLGEQNDFLRNMSLVALLSRLTHALHQMARTADTFAPRDPKGHGKSGDDEFKKIWAEYQERFTIKFSPRFIQFVEPLRKARNKVVHNGGEAKEQLPMDEVDFDKGEFYDTSFMMDYPQFVDQMDRVVVSQKQLNFAVKKSVELVKYAAEQLRGKQIEAVKKERDEAKKTIRRRYDLHRDADRAMPDG
jgi:hypothetical protein